MSYFLLVLLWFLFGLSNYKTTGFKKLLMIIACLSFAYGIIIEVLQGSLVETRTADIYDVLANGLGILTAVLVLIYFQTNLIKLKSKI